MKWCKKVDGRKYFVDAEIRDGEGNRFAEADSLYVMMKKGAEKL